MLADVDRLLARWRVRFADRPDRERQHLLLLALEREQIVAVAYREEAVAERVAALEVPSDVRSLIRQTLVWIWKDEQLHAEYLRGELLRSKGLGPTAVVYGRQIQGAMSGWTSATSNHHRVRTAPFRAGAAGVLVAVAGLTGRIPPALRRELGYQTFRRYCELNVALEASAELAYQRLVAVSPTRQERDVIEQIRRDEERHREAFGLLAGALDHGDRLKDQDQPDALARGLGELSIWFLPAARRPGPTTSADRRTFGSRSKVVVRRGDSDDQMVPVLRECLDQAGLGEAARGARRVALRASFMLGYDRRDRSNVNHPEMVAQVARYLSERGVKDVAVLEAPTVYAKAHARRSVADVASYFGFASPHYRLVDISEDLRPFRYERGFVQQAVCGTWVDADLRIVMPKLRTDPTEFAHLGLSTLEGSTGAIEDTFYAGRQIDFRSATMMLLDVAPPDFSVVDAWAPVADGVFGVMGCHRPAEVRHIYAGTDALSVDEAVLCDLGIDDPRRAPIVRLAYHWFGLDPAPFVVEGDRPPLGAQLRGAHASVVLRGLGALSYPVYAYLSRQGVRFAPPLDPEAFPPHVQTPPLRAALRWATQRVFGIRPPMGKEQSSP